MSGECSANIISTKYVETWRGEEWWALGRAAKCCADQCTATYSPDRIVGGIGDYGRVVIILID
jgi:hypothetical protein